MRPWRVVVVAVVAALFLPASALALPSIPVSEFEPSTGCGCHSGLAAEWRPSMHAKALSDPLYLYKLDEAAKATDGALSGFCNACHGPIAVMTGELSGLDQSGLSEASAEGVSCDFCHRVTGTGSPVANTSQTVADDDVKRAQIKDPGAPHPAAYSEFHKTAEFCGACHDVIHPAVPGLLLEATYTEWLASPYAQQGIECQDCHMTPGPGPQVPPVRRAAGMGPERLGINSMTFAGGNVGLGDSARAEERLKAAASVKIEVPDDLEPGSSAVVTATVTNVGAGHYLPTGLTEVRQMWLEIVAEYSDGTTETVGRRDFGTVLEDAKGGFPVELWEAVRIRSDDRIAPLRAAVTTATLEVGEQPLEITATLYYRSAPEEMAKAAGVEIPTTEMAADRVAAVPLGVSPAVVERDEPEGSAGAAPVVLAAVGVAAIVGIVLWRRSRRGTAR